MIYGGSFLFETALFFEKSIARHDKFDVVRFEVVEIFFFGLSVRDNAIYIFQVAVSHQRSRAEFRVVDEQKFLARFFHEFALDFALKRRSVGCAVFNGNAGRREEDFREIVIANAIQNIGADEGFHGSQETSARRDEVQIIVPRRQIENVNACRDDRQKLIL